MGKTAPVALCGNLTLNCIFCHRPTNTCFGICALSSSVGKQATVALCDNLTFTCICIRTYMALTWASQSYDHPGSWRDSARALSLRACRPNSGNLETGSIIPSKRIFSWPGISRSAAPAVRSSKFDYRAIDASRPTLSIAVTVKTKAQICMKHIKYKKENFYSR